MENISSHESLHQPEIPRLPAAELKQLIVDRFNTPKYMATTMSAPEVWLDILKSEALDLRINYPHLAYRGSELGNNINFSLGGTESIQDPDAFNFDDAFLMAFILMKDTYTQHGIELPADTEQAMWLKTSPIETVGDFYDLIGKQQLILLHNYPDFAEALLFFGNLNLHEYQSELSPSFAVLAGAEIYDAFTQMEAAKAV